MPILLNAKSRLVGKAVAYAGAWILHEYVNNPENIWRKHIRRAPILANSFHVLKCHTFGALLSDQRALNGGRNVRCWEALIAVRLFSRSRLQASILPRARSCRNWMKAMVFPRWIEICRKMRQCSEHSWTRKELVVGVWLCRYEPFLDYLWWILRVSFVYGLEWQILEYRIWCRNNLFYLCKVSITHQLPATWRRRYDLCRSCMSWFIVAILQVWRWHSLSWESLLGHDGSF